MRLQCIDKSVAAHRLYVSRDRLEGVVSHGPMIGETSSARLGCKRSMA